MAKGALLYICLLLHLASANACYLPQIIDISVPERIPYGHKITTVEVADCDTKSLQVVSEDPDFRIERGDLVTINSVYVRPGGRKVSVVVRDNSGSRSEVTVFLHREPRRSENLLRRTKRRWGPPPLNIMENESGPFPREIETIQSDSAAKYPVYYTLSGPGYNEDPMGVFSFDRDSGKLFLNKPVDREQYPSFVLTTNVYHKTTNMLTDLPLNIIIDVDDMNDNAPEFTSPLRFSVAEQCSAGTVVGKVDAADRDLAGSDHVAIRYRLLTGANLFSINDVTGVISTKSTTLDRETTDKHLVTVEIRDMKGQSNGLWNTGTATIMLSDINDNPPTFKQPSFTASVLENEIGKPILRIPVDDRDLVNTDNWISNFIITKGNENGNFRIDVDPKTNEGVLYVTKPLDFEQTPNVKLEVTARNKADLQGTTAPWNTAAVDLTVTDVDEGPEFIPPIKYITVKENTPNRTVIGTYTALDPETKSGAGIMYYKGTDPASWILFDRTTGELRVANTIDRESSFVQNGLYNITVKAVDASAKTGTGTVVITVEDVNDNVPLLPTDELLLCEKEGELGSLVLVADDKDGKPYAEPFTFSMTEDNDGKWSINKINDTAAVLQQLKDLHTGTHRVDVQVMDLQGSGKVQTLTVRICRCVNGVCPAKGTSVQFGSLGVLAMLLPFLLLLLLALLLAVVCVTKRQHVKLDDMMDAGGVLLKSNTEAPGEEVDSSLLTAPTVAVDSGVKGSMKGSMLNVGWVGNKSASSMQDNGMYNANMTNTNIVTTDTQYFSNYNDQYGMQFGEGHLLGSGFENRQLIQDASLLHTWQTNGRYLEQKLFFMGAEDEGRYADDVAHNYGFEGVGSAAGSVGCCSDFAEESLDFLDTLGPKFKTLADVCVKR